MSSWRINWKGADVRRRVEDAARMGIDDTMAAAGIEAKANHSGWKNITGNAEGSISITEPAHKEGGAILGRWGSKAVAYFIWLELKHGAALRTAADKTYKSLKRRIQAHLR